MTKKWGNNVINIKVQWVIWPAEALINFLKFSFKYTIRASMHVMYILQHKQGKVFSSVINLMVTDIFLIFNDNL